MKHFDKYSICMAEKKFITLSSTQNLRLIFTYSHCCKEKTNLNSTLPKKKGKKIKILLRNMHPSTDVDEITIELVMFDHKVERIYNNRKTTYNWP